MTEWFRPAGSAARDGFDLAISPGEPGWEHTGLYVATIESGGSRTIETGDCEWIVLPLSGGATVEAGGETVELEGRPDVFAGPSDLAYVPRATTFTVTSAQGARIAFPHARAAASYPFRKLDAKDVPVELRGAGRASSRRSTTSSCAPRPVPRATTRSGTSGCTAPTNGRSTYWPRCGPATWCWCRTAGTGRRWRRPATTCTTST